MGSTSFAITRWINSEVAVYDTMTFAYDAIPFFHSTECGAMYNFRINHVGHTSNGIDSIVMLTTTVTNSNSPAMRIYFTDFQQ